MKFTLALSSAALLAAGAVNAATLTDIPAGTYLNVSTITASTCGKLSATLAVGASSSSIVAYTPAAGKTAGSFTSISGVGPTYEATFATTGALSKVNNQSVPVYAIATVPGAVPVAPAKATYIIGVAINSITAGAANKVFANAKNTTGATYVVAQTENLIPFGCTYSTTNLYVAQ